MTENIKIVFISQLFRDEKSTYEKLDFSRERHPAKSLYRKGNRSKSWLQEPGIQMNRISFSLCCSIGYLVDTKIKKWSRIPKTLFIIGYHSKNLKNF